MGKKRLLWQIYPAYLVITLLALLAAGWYCSSSFRRFHFEQVADGLESRAHLAARQLLDRVDLTDADQVDNICDELGAASSVRITVVLASGRVVGDSQDEPAQMANHADRPEIIQALRQGIGQSRRPSPTLGINMMYVAVPLVQDGKRTGVVRTALPVTAINETLRNIRIRILWGGILIALCAAAISLVVSRRISLPIEAMKETAREFASGRLDLRVPISDVAELAELGTALNMMAQQLHEKIETITSERNETETVLSGMLEGVIAVDPDGNVVTVNKAACDFLGADAVEVQGRSLEEVVRNTDIQKFVENTLASKQATETEISISNETTSRSLRLHGTQLVRGPNTRAGALIVMSDTTRIHRLENVRRDFVANVSHELKTPITSIKGFVETLLEGAVNDPEKAQSFLEIISRHSDRLNAIVDDLLTLSRLEEDSERRTLSLEKLPIRPVLVSAIELTKTLAHDKKIDVELDCAQDIEAAINSALLEQAVLNLIQNAIKYSDQGALIQITVHRQKGAVAIVVKDSGCGIAQRHQDRIFERFYVVDKGRSRKLGGTGLGLAIVKHIAQVHGGSVIVQSEVGKGSTFKVTLPES